MSTPERKQPAPKPDQRQGEPQRTGVPFDTVAHRVSVFLQTFRGGLGDAPKPGTDEYAFAALALYLTQRLDFLRMTRSEREPIVVPDYVKRFLAEYLEDAAAAGLFGTPEPPRTPSPQPGTNPDPRRKGASPEPSRDGRINKPGDDTPPDILGWMVYVVARPSIPIVEPTSSDDEDCGDDSADRGSAGSARRSG